MKQGDKQRDKQRLQREIVRNAADITLAAARLGTIMTVTKFPVSKLDTC